MDKVQGIGFIGTGKVGATLARLWFKAGFKISAVYNRTPDKADELAKLVSAIHVTVYDEVVASSDIVFLTVADDAIAPIVKQLSTLDWNGKTVVHTSGAASLDVLQPLAEQGARVCSLHPAFPFADVETSVNELTGATFAIEALDDATQIELTNLVDALQGQVIVIPAGKKALYHVALVFASNYTVTLYAIAETLLLSLGANKGAAHHALNSLLVATVDNIKKQGIPQALTGPLVRADIGTIQAHLTAIDDEPLRTLYTHLARQSFPMLDARGVDTSLIEKVLQDSTDETPNDS